MSRIKEARARCFLGLDALMDRLPKQLSGGQRQRVAMGRAIVRRATLFLFDEPLSNLDAALRAEVRVEIRRLHDRLGATTLYVTHDQVEAMTLADTLWVMNGGLVEQKGAPLEVYEKPRSRFVATFLGSPQMNMVDGKLVVRGRTEADVDRRRRRRGRPPWWTRSATARTLVELGRAVEVGVRPHDFAVCAPPEAAAATLKVELVEALGFEAFAYGWLRASGPRIVARLEAADARRVKAGEDSVPLAAWSEPGTGASVRPGDGARPRREVRATCGFSFGGSANPPS